MREVCWLPFRAKSRPLSPLGLIPTIDAKPKQTSTLQPGCQRLDESVVLDRCYSGYKGNHFVGIMLGGSTTSGLLEGHLLLSWIRCDRALNAPQERIPSQLPTGEMKKKINSSTKPTSFCSFYKEVFDLLIASNLANLGWFLKVSFN
jgi:hypothetical protein